MTTEKALNESVPNGHFGASTRIDDAISTDASMKLEKFPATKLARSSITTTKATITGAKASTSESDPVGLYLGNVRPFETALLKDEVVPRALAALTFSPDTASTVSSLKKIRRELTGWGANGHVDS